jgi:hypothetical protein
MTGDEREVIANGIMHAIDIPDDELAEMHTVEAIQSAFASRFLAALAAAGLTVVPVEATRAMAEAGNIEVRCRRDRKVGLLNAFEIYHAMIAAAQEGESDIGGM